MTNISTISTDPEKIIPLNWYKQLLKYPFQFCISTISRWLLWPFFKKGFTSTAHLFFGEKMQIILPAAKHIYIMGYKGSLAEIKLTKWMMSHIKPGWSVMDIGAHFGFDTLLLHTLVGPSGKVAAFEPSPLNYKVLKINVLNKKNIQISSLGIGHETCKQLLAEKGVLKSENNSFYFLAKANTILAETTTLDTWCIENKWRPRFIRIDVEGWEWNVIKGAGTVLGQKPILAITIATKNFEKIYYPAVEWLLANGYLMYSLSQDGDLMRCPDAWTELQSSRMHSDTFIFKAKHS